MQTQPIPIYPAERQAGLENVLSDPTHGSVTIASKITPVVDEEALDVERQMAVAANLLHTDATNRDQFDLYYLHSVLVTTGWNKNDDVFGRDQVWGARHTPEDKPFNLEHDPEIIIGHMTGSRVIDDQGNVVDDSIEDTDLLPDKFHILTSAVIYRHLSSKKPHVEARAAEIIEGIRKGEWFVSMEALFNDFHYAVTYPDGRHRIIARDESSAFLTKHLRAYGGRGTYQDWRLGRYILGVAFSGKGLTKTPANSESITIDEEVTPFIHVFAHKLDSQTDNEESSMANPETPQLEATIAELKAELKRLDAEKVQAKYDSYEKTVAGQKAEIEDKDRIIAEFEEKINSIGASLEDEKNAKEAAERQLEESKAELKEAHDKLAEIEAQALAANRTSALVDKGVEKAEAEKIVEKFTHLNDDQFADIVTLQAELVEAKKAKEEDKSGKTDDETETDQTEVDAAEANADDKALEDAEEEQDSTLGSQGDTPDDEQETLLASLSEYLGETLQVPAEEDDSN